MAGSGKTFPHSPNGWLAVMSDGAAFVAGADQFEQHRGLGLVLADVGEVVEDQQVELVEAVDGGFKAEFAPGDLQFLHEVGGSGEQYAPAVFDQGEADGRVSCVLPPPGGPIRIRLAPFSSQLSPAQMDLLVEGIRPLPGRHVTDRQMRLYMTFRQTDGPVASAARASISAATAYRFEHDRGVPSAGREPRGRHRPDPLVDFFDAEVVPTLKAAPDLRAIAIFEEMQRRHLDLFAGARRTLERRIPGWRALHGADQASSSARCMNLAEWGCRNSPTWRISAS